MPIRRSAARRHAGLTAALLALSLSLPAVAAADPEPLAGVGSGLSAPAGVVQTPDGALWVADPVGGICRVTTDPTTGLVPSPWCTPGVRETDAGGEADQAGHADFAELAPVLAADRPEDPSGLVFDPATDNLYASDRSSRGGGIWRLHLDASTGAIATSELIAVEPDRIVGLTLAPAPVAGGPRELFYVTKRAGAIMRVADPAAPAPDPPVRLGVLGDDGEPTSIAAGADAVYVAHGAVTRFALDGAATAARAPVAGLSGLDVTAVQVDTVHGRLYAGTSSPDLEDAVHVVDLSSGSAETYEQGFAGVTALGVGADGALTVADDPIMATGAEASVGQGRLWRVALAPLGRPAAEITAGPPDAGRSGDVSFSYASRAGAAFECRLDDADFAPCPGGGTGEQSYAGLTEGAHQFWVRGTEGAAGPSVTRRFVVDWTAPRVTIATPQGDYVEGGPAPRVRFWADEPRVTFSCSVDGAPYVLCFSGNPVQGLSAGTHAVRVVGVDAAGNRSDADAQPAALTLPIRARVQPGTSQPPADQQPEPTSPGGSVGQPAPAPQPAANDAPGSAPQPTSSPRRFLATLRLAGGSPVTARPLRVRLAAPVAKASLRIIIRNARGHRVLRRAVRVSASSRERVALRLSRGEQRRLRPGRYTLIAVLRTRAGVAVDAQTAPLRLRPRA